MTDRVAASMRRRAAGQAVIEKTLTEQAKARPRGTLARVLGANPLSDEARPWYIGARGEVEVGRILDTLPADWISYHSLPIGNRETDIDHVIVGPAGVFTINTKSHRGRNVWVADRTVLVGKDRKAGYIPAAEREAYRLTHLLRTRIPDLAPARPLLVFVAPSKLTIKSKPEQVVVLDSLGLPRWLRKQKAVLTADERVLLTEHMDDPGSWPPRLAPRETDAAPRFTALEREVRTAIVLRSGWSLVGIGAVVWGSIALLPGIVMSIVQ